MVRKIRPPCFPRHSQESRFSTKGRHVSVARIFPCAIVQQIPRRGKSALYVFVMVVSRW
jgi:hypothetical protein